MNHAHGCFVIPFFLQFFLSFSLHLQGTGGPTFWPFFRAWSDSYSLIDPSVTMDFENAITGGAGISKIAGGNDTFDFAIIDGFRPTDAQYEAGLQVFPVLTTSLVAQVNFAFGKDIVLERSVLADIFMGNITNWNHSAIKNTNPNITFPNAPITVYYRSDVSPINTLWTTGLSSFSQSWNSTYNISMTWPAYLQSLSNFVPWSDGVAMNGALAANPNSIGYVPYYMIARDPSLHYAKLIHKYSNKSVAADGIHMTDAGDSIVLNSRLEGGLSVDPQNSEAWPVANYIYALVSTKPTDCEQARAFYKFMRWSINDLHPRSQTHQLGCGPLSDHVAKLVDQALQKIQCDGQSIATFTDSDPPGWEELFFFIVSNMTFFLGIALSLIHIYHFSTSKINLIYSIVFIVGTTLTLISPIFWFFRPDRDGFCGARIWTGSLGFSILLGTMFSRTWQLNDIYILQSKKAMDALRHKVSTNATLIQLAATLVGTIATNFFILLIWTASDPLRSIYVIVDPVELTGYYTCTSDHLQVWLILELLFFLSLLSFGIYVIYRTWSFQRRASLVETRWVLLALYNVILNIFAVVPLFAFVNITERILALVVIVSIDLSAGSIVCAVLLPRLIQKLDLSSATPEPMSMGAKGGSTQNQHKKNASKMKPSRHEYSRTPEDELAKRLEEPMPLRKLHTCTEKEGDTAEAVELAPLQTPSNLLEDSTSSNFIHPPYNTPQTRDHGFSIAEEELSTTHEEEQKTTIPVQKTKTPTQKTKTPLASLKRLSPFNRGRTISEETTGPSAGLLGTGEDQYVL